MNKTKYLDFLANIVENLGIFCVFQENIDYERKSFELSEKWCYDNCNTNPDVFV